MICPECGYDMGNRNKCYRCGFEAKTLVVVDDHEEEEPKKSKEEEVETKVIDPCNVYLTHPYGYEDYDVFGSSAGPFSSLFDELFGDPISDLLGGLFGINLNPRRTVVREEPPPKPKRKQGPIIVVDDIEIIPADEVKKKNTEQASQKHSKHRFRKGDK